MAVFIPSSALAANDPLPLSIDVFTKSPKKPAFHCDMDGTIAETAQIAGIHVKLNPACHGAIYLLLKAGIPVAIITGRRQAMVECAMSPASPDDYSTGTRHGLYVKAVGDDKLTQTLELPDFTAAAAALEVFKVKFETKHGVIVIFHCDDTHVELNCIDKPEELKAEVMPVMQALDGYGPIYVAQELSCGVELIPTGMNKALACEYLEKNDARLEGRLIFGAGDGANDKPMFKWLNDNGHVTIWIGTREGAIAVGAQYYVETVEKFGVILVAVALHFYNKHVQSLAPAGPVRYSPFHIGYRTMTVAEYRASLKAPRAVPVSGEALSKGWEARMKDFYITAPAMLEAVMAQAKAVAVKAREHGINTIYWIGASGSNNANQIAGMLLSHVNVVSRKIIFKTVDEAMDIDPTQFDHAMVIFTSRTGTTTDTVGLVKKIKAAQVFVCTIAMTDINSPLSHECVKTIHMPSCYNAEMRDGELVTTMAPLLAMAGFLKIWYDWTDADKLLDILKWVCKTIPSIKVQNRVEHYQAALKIIEMNPAFVFLPGPEDTLPLREQAGLCFASELLKIPFIMIATERIRWGMCEAMGRSNVTIRFQGDVNSFAENKYYKVPAMLKYLEIVIPMVDMSSLDGPKWLKRFGEMFVQTGAFHSIISNWLAEKTPGQLAWATPVYDLVARPDKLA